MTVVVEDVPVSECTEELVAMWGRHSPPGIPYRDSECALDSGQRTMASIAKFHSQYFRSSWSIMSEAILLLFLGTHVFMA
jgi:hypothetical protein